MKQDCNVRSDLNKRHICPKLTQRHSIGFRFLRHRPTDDQMAKPKPDGSRLNLQESAYIFLKHDHNHTAMQGEARSTVFRATARKMRAVS
jgi:hypothetical protein